MNEKNYSISNVIFNDFESSKTFVVDACVICLINKIQSKILVLRIVQSNAFKKVGAHVWCNTFYVVIPKKMI